MSFFIPQEILTEILDRADLVSVISEYVPLKKAGKDYKGLCPFHQEKTPSFMVNPQKKIFHCFGCGEGGNLFTFVMKMEHLSFLDAARRLATRAGMDLSSFETHGGEPKKPTEILYKINRYALWFFESVLASPEGMKAKAYLLERGISKLTCEEFHLGYALPSWGRLVEFLSEKKVPLNLASELGLVKKKQDGTYYDFFRDRLLFPVMDYEGRVIGFSGRRLADGPDVQEAKYINSPESPIYHKGQSIYGLFQAKRSLREKEEAVLVEGNFDLLTLHQLGIKNGVAPLGTALTLAQIKTITRFATRIVLMFDGDEAGKKATLRAIQLAQEAGFHPRVVLLPWGEDPDSWAKKNSQSSVIQAIQLSLPALEWLLSSKLEEAGARMSDRLSTARELLPYIEALPSVLERQAYLERLSQFFGIATSSFSSQDNSSLNHGKLAKGGEQKFSLERILLELYVRYPHLASEVAVGEKFFSLFEKGLYAEIGKLVCQQYEAKGGVALDQLIAFSDDPTKIRFLSELGFMNFEWSSDEEIKKYIEDGMGQLKKRAFKIELKKLTSEIHVAEIKGDTNQVQVLLGQKVKTLENIKNNQTISFMKQR